MVQQCNAAKCKCCDTVRHVATGGRRHAWCNSATRRNVNVAAQYDMVQQVGEGMRRVLIGRRLRGARVGSRVFRARALCRGMSQGRPCVLHPARERRVVHSSAGLLFCSLPPQLILIELDTNAIDWQSIREKYAVRSPAGPQRLWAAVPAQMWAESRRRCGRRCGLGAGCRHRLCRRWRRAA
jgi:hypothetical protein